MPTYITQCIRINAPKREVWNLIRSFDALADLVDSPYERFKQLDFETHPTRLVKMMPGLKLTEYRSELEDPHYYKTDLEKNTNSGPFAGYQTKLWVRHLDPQACELQFSCLYELKLGPISGLMNALMIKEKCTRDGKRLLKTIKRAAEAPQQRKMSAKRSEAK